MHKRLSLLLTVLLFLALSIQSDASLRRAIAITQNSSIPAPEQIIGFRPGDDRKLASWAQVVQYFQKLAATSDRVKFEEIGKSTMGAPFVYAMKSSKRSRGSLPTRASSVHPRTPRWLIAKLIR